jgi:hypothetical protein
LAVQIAKEQPIDFNREPASVAGESVARRVGTRIRLPSYRRELPVVKEPLEKTMNPPFSSVFL